MTLRSFKPLTLRGHIDAAHQLLVDVPRDVPEGAVTVTISSATDAHAENSGSLVAFIDRMGQLASQRVQEGGAVDARIRAEREEWDSRR